jgi:hypothetical protein
MNNEAVTTVQKLELTNLARERPERPEWCTRFGGLCASAASVCIEKHGYPIEVELRVDGDYDYEFIIEREEVNDATRRFNADMERSSEFGAYGISALVVPEITDLKVIEVSRKGTGFDFWLGSIEDTGPLFQRKARLEVSGILNGNESTIKRRTTIKLQQITPTDNLMPGYVSIVEFSDLRVRVVQKKDGQ